MALTAGHFYWLGSDSSKLLLCTDDVGFEFVRLPDGNVQKFAADPSAQYVDLQTMAFTQSTPFPKCTLDGDAMEAVEAYSSDGTLPNVLAVMVRPVAASALQDKSRYIVVPRNSLANIAPAGSLGPVVP